MADFYCDHGAYFSQLGSVPLWGVPQDGDGSSKDAATASSIASILFTAVPTSGSVVVCGVTFSSPSGVLNAASTDAAANAMASLINASTTAVGSSVAAGTPQLRNLVYARGPGSGAPAGTCQIMMRIGSTLLNHENNSSVGISHSLNNAPTITQFAGGSGGCFGWFFNPTPIGVSNSLDIGTYGAWLALPMVPPKPTPADTVWVRTGGSNKTISCSFPSGSRTLSHAAFGTNFVFDNNTKWTGDQQNGVLKAYFSSTNWGNSYVVRTSAPTLGTSYTALNPGGFEIEWFGNTATSFSLGPMNGTDTHRERWVNVKFRDSGIETSGNKATFSPFIVSSPNGMIHRRYEGCDFVVTNPRSTLWLTPFSSPYNTGAYFQFKGCRFDFNISGIANPGVLMDANSYQSDVTHEFQDCDFLGYPSGYQLVNSTTNWQVNGRRFVVIMDNCRGVQVPGSYLGLPTANNAMMRPDQHLVVHDNRTASALQGYRYEDCRGVLEWLPDASPAFPTLTATVAGVNTPYSMRALWLQMANITPADPFELPAFKAFSQLSSGSRTLTLEMLVPSGLSSGISAQFTYLDTGGNIRAHTAGLLAPSSAQWTGAAGYPSHVPAKLSVVTEYPVLAGSEITCRVSFDTNAPEPVTHVYLDPEIGVS